MGDITTDPRIAGAKVYGVMTLTDNGWKMEVHEFEIVDRVELDQVIELFSKLREFVKAD